MALFGPMTFVTGHKTVEQTDILNIIKHNNNAKFVRHYFQQQNFQTK